MGLTAVHSGLYDAGFWLSMRIQMFGVVKLLTMSTFFDTSSKKMSLNCCSSFCTTLSTASVTPCKACTSP